MLEYVTFSDLERIRTERLNRQESLSLNSELTPIEGLVWANKFPKFHCNTLFQHLLKICTCSE